jgi:hypothetical protein
VPKPRSLNAEEAKRTLANRLGPRVDRLRQFGTKFGVRSYRVFLCWDKFSGDEYGDGERKHIARIEILPTPRVRSLDGVSLNSMNAGMVPIGSVRLDLVSVTYTYDTLRGKVLPVKHEDHIPEPWDFYYEIVEDGRGDPQPVRSMFRLLSEPHRAAGSVSWQLMLQRISGDNKRNGASGYV